jgi:hypothetical protein
MTISVTSPAWGGSVVLCEGAQASRKSLAELVDANDRAFRASRRQRAAWVASHAPECTELPVEGDRGFESISLQRRVCCEPDDHGDCRQRGTSSPTRPRG